MAARDEENLVLADLWLVNKRFIAIRDAHVETILGDRCYRSNG
jgi:hypothetical protein